MNSRDFSNDRDEIISRASISIILYCIVSTILRFLSFSDF